jgi:hypothetical protein
VQKLCPERLEILKADEDENLENDLNLRKLELEDDKIEAFEKLFGFIDDYHFLVSVRTNRANKYENCHFKYFTKKISAYKH